jgi:predicted secreted protein
MANKLIGKGSSLELSIATVFTAIAGVKRLGPPKRKMDFVESTDLASVVREWLATIRDEGEASMTIIYDSDTATHAALNTSFEAGTSESWKVKFPAASSTVIAFTGIISAFEWDDVVVDGLITAGITIKINSALTITP